MNETSNFASLTDHRTTQSERTSYALVSLRPVRVSVDCGGTQLFMKLVHHRWKCAPEASDTQFRLSRMKNLTAQPVHHGPKNMIVMKTRPHTSMTVSTRGRVSQSELV
jgi:hypothetical protein